MAKVTVHSPGGGSSYIPPTYTPGSVLFGDVGGAPTEDNSNLFWNNTTNRLGVGINSSLLATLHSKGDSNSTGNSFYSQSLSNGMFFQVANIDVSSSSSFVTINGMSNQNNAPILTLDNNSLHRFSFRHDGLLAFQGGAYCGDAASGGMFGNALLFNNTPASGGITLGYNNGITYGGVANAQVQIGRLNSYTGTGAPGNPMILMEFMGTFNQTNGNNETAVMRVTPTLTSITGTEGFNVLDFDPTITAATIVTGLRMRPTTCGNGFGLGTTVPTAFLHVGAATAAAMPQFKFTLGGTILTSPAAGVMEADNSHVYWTNSANTRFQLDQQTSGVAITPSTVVATSITVVENIVDCTPNTDHTAVGDVTSTFNAGATITIMDLVRMHSDGEWALTDASAVSTSTGTLAIALAAGTDGNPMKVALPGSYVRDDTWNWTPGAQLFMSLSSGQITATAPSATNEVVRVIGEALTADVIHFLPSPDHLVVA